jgi:hypothetical protein
LHFLRFTELLSEFFPSFRNFRQNAAEFFKNNSVAFPNSRKRRFFPLGLPLLVLRKTCFALRVKVSIGRLACGR